MPAINQRQPVKRSYFNMITLENISKSFPVVKALDQITINFKAGEVHAVCGENGAGKSTLMNLITGNMQPDSGTIYWMGTPLVIRNVQHARNLGISIVYQERSLVDSLTIAENIFPGNQPLTRWGTINYKKLYSNTQSLLTRLDLHEMSPLTPVRKLSAARKQMIEIAKALASQPRLLILDEPSASITDKEINILFDIIRKLKQEGVCIIYISHRMSEIRRIADKVSVLKDGKYQGTMDARITPLHDIIRMMVGRELLESKYTSNARDEIVLSINKLSSKRFTNVSFSLHKGEVLGFAGLVGAGRTELAKAIFGAGKVVSGDILKDGFAIHPTHPAEAVEHSIAYIPEDRKISGLFLDKSIAENIISTKLITGWYSPAGNDSVAEKFVQQLGIRTPSVKQKAGKLSGGNQQKVVIAKWLNTASDIYMVDEPTHGVDVGAKAEIYAILKDLTAAGKSVILISSELQELLLLADRIAVMCRGKLVKILNRNEADEETIMQYAAIQV